MALTYRVKGTFVFIFSLIILIFGMLLRDSPTALSAADIGTKTTVYLKVDFFYTLYFLLQIPLGIVFDRFATRKVYFCLILISVVGALIPIYSNALVRVGYFLIVAPMSGAFLGALVVASRWFTHRFFAIAIGFTQLVAAIGILLGQEPLTHLIHKTGLSAMMKGAGGVGVVLALLSFIIFRENSRKKPPPFDRGHYKEEIRNFLKLRQVWWIGLYSLFAWGVIDLFGGYWGIHFLQTKFNFSPASMDMILGMFWLGFGLLSPLFGWISESLNNRLLLLRIGPAVGLVCSIILLYLPISSQVNVAFLFLGIGVVGAAHMLCFALMKDLFNLRIGGFSLGFINFFVVGGKLVFQPLTSLYFKISGAGNNPTLAEMEHVFILIPILFAISLLISLFFMKETHSLQIDENV